MNAMERGADVLKIAVLISGSGTNLAAIIEAIESGLPAEIVLVVSSRPDAYGIERARKAGIEVLVLNKSIYADPLEADKLIVSALRRAQADYVLMAGYMRKLSPYFLSAYKDRVVNLHPALLPSFVGAHAIEDAFNAGVKVSGVTVHFANEDYDKGPIIAQVPVEIREDDTVDSFEARIHEAEHRLYPQVLQLLVEGRVSIDDNRHVRISEKEGSGHE